MTTDGAALPKNYVCTVNDAQRQQIEVYCREHGWTFSDLPYGYWKAAGNKINVAAYHSGKLSVQGGNTAEFVLYFLEPEVLHTVGFGYDTVAADGKLNAEAVTPHGGIDESGKGDFFGPLVVAGVYVNSDSGSKLASAGVCDSKLIKSDKKITELAQKIRDVTAGNFAVVTVGPEAYNRLYGNFGNLNRLLAWGHAKVIEELLIKVPDCPRMLSDKFGNESLIRNALQTRGRMIVLDQQTKAESDVAVAAASILARDGFIRGMAKLSEAAGVELPRGAGANVQKIANEIAARDPELLKKISKTHFRTWYRAMNLPEPEKIPYGRLF
ncbi:MAG: ribonuclease HIII [Lentisphaerae bacterium]|nr:ribonuclease HIII [Lentisphaerota bacterium]